MDPVTLSLIMGGASLFLHLLGARITSKAPPTSTPPAFPTTFGHGELIQFIRQEISNAIAGQPAVPAMPAVPGTVDINQLLASLVALVEKSLIPTPTVPAK